MDKLSLSNNVKFTNIDKDCNKILINMYINYVLDEIEKTNEYNFKDICSKENLKKRILEDFKTFL